MLTDDRRSDEGREDEGEDDMRGDDRRDSEIKHILCYNRRPFEFKSILDNFLKTRNIKLDLDYLHDLLKLKYVLENNFIYPSVKYSFLPEIFFKKLPLPPMKYEHAPRFGTTFDFCITRTPSFGLYIGRHLTITAFDKRQNLSIKESK